MINIYASQNARSGPWGAGCSRGLPRRCPSRRAAYPWLWGRGGAGPSRPPPTLALSLFPLFSPDRLLPAPPPPYSGFSSPAPLSRPQPAGNEPFRPRGYLTAEPRRGRRWLLGCAARCGGRLPAAVAAAARGRDGAAAAGGSGMRGGGECGPGPASRGAGWVRGKTA